MSTLASFAIGTLTGAGAVLFWILVGVVTQTHREVREPVHEIPYVPGSFADDWLGEWPPNVDPYRLPKHYHMGSDGQWWGYTHAVGEACKEVVSANTAWTTEVH